jgi:hypothetical protein
MQRAVRNWRIAKLPSKPLAYPPDGSAAWMDELFYQGVRRLSHTEATPRRPLAACVDLASGPAQPQLLDDKRLRKLSYIPRRTTHLL